MDNSDFSAEKVVAFLGTPVIDVRVVGGSHGYRHLTATLPDGRGVFVKTGPPGEELSAEARGLRWLAEAAAVPVPDVLAVGDRTLAIELLPPGGRPSAEGAYRFGAGLARLHAAGADEFGAPWRGFIAGLPLDNAPLGNALAGDTPDTPAGVGWPDWYAERRVLPFLRRAHDAGTLTAADVRLVETVTDRIAGLAGPAEPPSRIHGDCWSGNVLWPDGRAWLIDPAAHGGHRETDLAMLALFGAPHLDRILAGYDDAVPLAEDWRSRVPLHQLHPLLVHACLFGASYREQVLAAARSALSP